MKTTPIGLQAENAVAAMLASKGYEIIARNWRTKKCEIDLVAKKENIIYMVEVKYRSQTAQGNGLDYVTPAKLRQMEFAAAVWNSQNDWEGDYRLIAAAVGGHDFSDIITVEI